MELHLLRRVSPPSTFADWNNLRDLVRLEPVHVDQTSAYTSWVMLSREDYVRMERHARLVEALSPAHQREVEDLIAFLRTSERIEAELAATAS